jgi:hypothetical protein
MCPKGTKTHSDFLKSSQIIMPHQKTSLKQAQNNNITKHRARKNMVPHKTGAT